MPTFTKNEILADIRGFITENFLYMMPGLTLTDDDNLLAKRVLDSMGIAELLGFLEERFGVIPTDMEITEENMGSLQSIATLVHNKLQNDVSVC